VEKFITLAKGKFAIVTFLALIQDSPHPFPPGTSSLTSPSTCSIVPIRQVVPKPATASSPSPLSFCSPSRLTLSIFSSVSRHLPARKLTFVVSVSGSGKSTIAQIILDLYSADSGTVLLDDTDLRYLDQGWVRVVWSRVYARWCWKGKVSWGTCVWACRTPRGREAYRAVMFYVFVGGLKAGYETISAVEVQFRPVFQKNLRTVNVIMEVIRERYKEPVRSMMKAYCLNNGSGGCVFIFGTALNDRQ